MSLNITNAGLAATLTVMLTLTGCMSSGTSREDIQAEVEAAVANPARPENDIKLDDKRKPVEVLTFFQVQPGMKVIDVFGGGGYYTEILSHLVGDSGSVTLYNNNPWNNFVTKQVSERLADNRLPNVNALTAEPEALANITEQYDAALFILGMHDIYYEDLENGWTAINVGQFLSDIHKLLKPGGVLGIVDHNAAAGTDAAVVGKTLHRVDPVRIIEDLEAAGFQLEGESGALHNPGDDLTELVFKPELRWQSDRSVLRFRKI